MGAITVHTIVNGDGAGNTNFNAWGIDPIAKLVAATTADTFVNKKDRRTFLLIKNASGTHGIDPQFDYSVGFGAGAGMLHPMRSKWEQPDSAVSSRGAVGGLLPDGKSKLYGPFNHFMFGDTIPVNYYKDQVSASEDVTGISVAAFYLPRVDDFTGASSTSADVPSPLGANASLATVQTISLDGLEPTFTDHSNFQEGFGFPVRRDAKGTDGLRRMLWVRNYSGSNDVQLVFAGAERLMGTLGASTPLAFPLSTGADVTVQGQWVSNFIDDGEEFLLGPWDPRLWALRGSIFGQDMTNHFSLRAVSSGTPTYTPGTTTGLDFAWLELPV